MSYAYGGALIAGAHAHGAPGLGLLAETIPGDGLNGAAYVYGALSLPADNGKEISAVITRWPTLGTLTVYPDFSFDYAGSTDYLLYELRVDGALTGTDIGYGPSIGRVDLVVGGGDGGTLSGAVVLDAGVAAGELSVPNASELGGGVTLDAAAAAGNLSGTIVSEVGGGVALNPAEAAGQLVGDTTGVLPEMGAGMRTIRAGRLVPQWLPALDVDEVDNLTADMSTVLGTDDAIVDVEITCRARVGTDPSDPAVLYGDWQVQGPLVRQRLVGSLGVVGVTYLLRVRALGASGKAAVAAAFFKVVRQA